MIAMHASWNRMAFPAENELIFMLKKKTVELLLLMALCAVGAAAFLFLIGQDALDKRLPFRFFADLSLGVDATGLFMLHVELLILSWMPKVKVSACLCCGSPVVSQELLL